MHKTVRVNVIINIIRTLTMTFLSFLTFPYVCRALNATGLGLYSWATAFVYYFFVLARISIPNIAVRECVKVKDNPDLLAQKVQEFFILQAIPTLVSFTLLTVLSLSLQSFDTENAKSVVFILSLNFLVGVFSFEWVFTALERHTYMAIRSIIIATIVDILIFSFIKYDNHVVLYSFFCVLTTLLTVVSNLIYLPKVMKFKRVKSINIKQYFPLLGVLLLISLAGAIYDKTDTFILGFIDKTKAAVGNYSVGMKGVEIIIGIITALSTVFIPRATKYYADNDERQFKNINIYSSNICLFIVVPAIAAMVGLATPLTALISGSYQSDVTGYTDTNLILIALASLMLTFSLSNIIYTQILIPMKKEKTYLLFIASGAILNIGLSLLFGLKIFVNHPAFGVALGTAITDLIICLGLIVMTRKHSMPIIFNKNNLKIFIFGIIIGVIFVVISPLVEKTLSAKISSLETVYLLEMGIMIVGCGLIYLIGLMITKERLISSFLRKRSEE